MAHPSSLNVPTDFVLAKEESRVPVEINNAELDTGFTPALALVTDGVMGNGQYAPGYLRRQFNGVGHGFAVSTVLVFPNDWSTMIDVLPSQVRADAVSGYRDSCEWYSITDHLQCRLIPFKLRQKKERLILP